MKAGKKLRGFFRNLREQIRYCTEVCTMPFEDRFRLTAFSLYRLFGCYVDKYIRRSYTPRQIMRRYAFAKKHGSVSPPRIVHIISHIEIGGSQKIVFDLVAGIPEHAMDILDLATHSYYAADEDAFYTFSSPDEAMTLLQSRGITLGHIHYYGDHSGMHQYLYRLLDYPGSTIRWIENANNPIAVFRHKRIARYVYVSQYAKALQSEQVHSDTVVYPGVDLQKFTSQRRTFGQDTVVHIGLVYRLENDKINAHTIDIIIRLIKRLRPNILVHIVGDGSNFFHYVDRARQAGVRKYIQFHGVVAYDALSELYDVFDVFIAPVHTESYGVVVPYAMVKRIPVVAMNIGALPEILGLRGYLCGSEHEFVEKVVYVLMHRRETETQVEQAALRAERRFSLEAMLARYRRIYRS